MPVFRVEKNSNYTTMCNYHLRDQGLSLKGKGLLSMLLSLPDTWNYSVRGLSSITPDGVDAHYTSPTVIRAIYEALDGMGFEKGNILEPSMGVGNFFGMLPDSMLGSRLYGVELDSITGRIAQKLYPQAEIKVAGFETTDRRDFYDLAVGNVPFGNYRVSDKPYDKLGFSIHNYFFAKALDQVRPGGIVAFVTSRYTMDSKNPDARKYLAQRAELLGAIRLPNNAFRANAGTDVVSDIIFLQKRDHPIDIEPDWVHLGLTSEGITLNSYFVDHPEMVLGEITTESTQYGKEECTVIPIPGADLGDQLHEAVQHIGGHYEAQELAPEEELSLQGETIPADPNVKNFSYAVVDGDVYFRENSIMRKADLSATATGRIKGMVELRTIVQELIDYQLNDYLEDAIAQKQRELNVDVARLKVLKADHQSQQYRLEDKLMKYFPAEIEKTQGFIKGFQSDIRTVAAHPLPEEGFCGMEVNGTQFTEKAEAGEAILAVCKVNQSLEPVPLGSYRGFKMELTFDSFQKEYQVLLKGEMTHRVPIGTSAAGNIQRLDNALAGIPARLEKAEQQLDNLRSQQEAAQAELGKPFPQEAELAEKSARLAELDALLNMDDRGNDDPDRERTTEKPSVLAELRDRAGRIPPMTHRDDEEVAL